MHLFVRPPAHEDTLRFAEVVRGPLAARCARSVVPIYEGVTDGYPVLVGTGTLFAIAEERFLVTAAHVAEDFIARRSVLLTSDATTGQHLQEVDYDWIAAGGEFDVAVFRLGTRAIDALGGPTFLRLSEVAMDFPRRWNLFYAYGFPREWSKPDAASLTVSAGPLPLFGGDYDGPTDAWRVFRPDTHIAIELADDSELPFDERQRIPGSLKGISGCSVWWLRGALEYPGRWQPEDARIVGVQTGTQNRDAVLVATRWPAALHLITRYCPDLAPAVEMYTKQAPRFVTPATFVQRR